ncbi:MAG: hypothetical protein U0T77_06795 [Chitinophagales bacterium]
MPFFRIILLSFLLIILTHCQKEVTSSGCINESQRTALLHELEPLTHDSIQLAAGERRLMNEIHELANDLAQLSDAIDTSISIQESYRQIKANFLQHAALAEQKANVFYQGSEASVILAKNAFVLMSYDALQRKYPAFMWTRLGVFAANEVRSGLVAALFLRYTLEINNVHIPLDNTGKEITDALLETCQILIQGQIDVLTDIGSLGILNSIAGAGRIQHEGWLTAEAREGFRLQEQAEQALLAGNCDAFQDIQTEAAIQFGAHEQIYILQPMWDKPMMQNFATLDKLLIQLTNQQFVFFGDIFIGTNKTGEAGKGYTVKLPANVNDLSNAQQRVQVAMNGFHTLNTLRKDAQWDHWIDYSMIKIGYFYDVYLPGVPL